MTYKYFIPIILSCLAVSNIQSARRAQQQSARKPQKQAEYTNTVSDFNKAIATYKDRQSSQNQRNDARKAIESFIAYGNRYYSPDSFDLRMAMARTFFNEKVDQRKDIGAFEKYILKTYYGPAMDNYYTIFDSTYANISNEACREDHRKAVEIFKSKEPLIVDTYKRILEEEKRNIPVVYLHHLGTEDALYKQTIFYLKNNPYMAQKVFQAAKSLPWVKYNQTGKPLYGNRVYFHLFKAFIREKLILNEQDRNQLAALTNLAIYLKNAGFIPKEPSFQEQHQSSTKIGEGWNVAWAILRNNIIHEYQDQPASAIPEDAQNLILDELLIRCGDRKERILYQKDISSNKNDCADIYTRFKNIIDKSDIKIVLSSSPF